MAVPAVLGSELELEGSVLVFWWSFGDGQDKVSVSGGWLKLGHDDSNPARFPIAISRTRMLSVTLVASRWWGQRHVL